MTETERPDYGAKAQDEIRKLEPQRGLVAAELEAGELELAELRGETPAYGADPAHPERATIDRVLTLGQSPRSLVGRYAGLSRRAIQRHRDGCHAESGGGG